MRDQLPHMRPGLRAGRAIRSSMAVPRARPSARRTVGPLGAVPSTGARCASTAISLMLAAPQRDRRLAAAIDTLAARSPLPVSVSVPDERRTLPATRPKTGPPRPGPRLAPRQWPYHHRPYAQNPLICIPGQ
jgi:hypothetical protein